MYNFRLTRAREAARSLAARSLASQFSVFLEHCGDPLVDIEIEGDDDEEPIDNYVDHTESAASDGK